MFDASVEYTLAIEMHLVECFKVFGISCTLAAAVEVHCVCVLSSLLLQKKDEECLLNQ